MELSWMSYILAGFLFATSQAQAGWLQHDLGHLSVFSTSQLNHWGHTVVIECIKGASGHWWNFRHNQHHVKPNVIRKDPDIQAPRLFLLGNKQPVSWGMRRMKGIFPFNWQHIYFWFIGPPMVLTFYFLFENLYFVAKRRDLFGFACVMVFIGRFYLSYYNVLGAMGTVMFYFFMRFLESHWFMLCTQINHITMDVDKDCELDWVTSQALTTCNVEPSFFNDWFTGHLNYQIEHHLFPLMPRHNYRKIQPLVKSLFAKHGLVYVEKSLLSGILDIHRSLRKSGELWYETYRKAHSS